MDAATKTELEAQVFRRLVEHFQKRSDVQNIDLMILAGFCRNCLGDWYREAAAEKGIPLGKDEARALVYGFARMNIDGHFPRWGVTADDAERTAEAIVDLFIDGIAKRPG